MTFGRPSIGYCCRIILKEIRSVMSRFSDIRTCSATCNMFQQQYSSNKYIFIFSCYSQLISMTVFLFCATAFSISFVCTVGSFTFPTFLSQSMNKSGRLNKQPMPLFLKIKSINFAEGECSTYLHYIIFRLLGGLFSLFSHFLPTKEKS